MSAMRNCTICLLICLSATAANAQFIAARATHSTTFLSDNLYDPDFSKAIGGDIYFSKGIKFIPYNFNYNIGLDYQQIDSLRNAFIVTGISYILATPSGFSATNPENVTYVTSNWLNYIDLDFYNGVRQADSTYVYQFAGEGNYNVGYVFGKQFFILGSAGLRYTYLPDYKETDHEFAALDIIFKLGFLWKFKKNYNKP